MKKLLALILALLMLASLAACSKTDDGSAGENTSTDTENTENTETTEPTETENTGSAVKISLWTCNSGDIDTWLHEAAERFNASQDQYVVEQSYAGSYSDLLAKLVAAPEEVPDIFHAETEGAYTYYSMPDMYVPLQKFVDEDGYDMSNIMGNLTATYTMDGAWQSMPLGNTVGGFFYNAELLEQAGINPETDLGSYEAIMEASKKLKDIGVATPFYFADSSSFYTMPLTAEGIQYVDNNNGKDATPTKTLIGEDGACHDETVKLFQFLKDMKAQDLMVPYGTASADARDLFVNGECAIFSGFISAFKGVYDAVGGKFEIGFHSVPTISDSYENLGVCTGGGTLFIGNTDEAHERGAWEFMKFLMTDENTTGYAMISGYLPITTTGVATAEYQDYLDNTFPTARAAIEAEENTPETCFNAWLPMFNDFHGICKQYMAKAYDEDGSSAEDLVAQFAAAADEAIELYNLSH